MPDISKLPELAEIFCVGIDEILNNEKGTQLIKTIVESDQQEVLEYLEVSKEAFINAAPLLEIEQADSIFKTIEGEFSLKELSVIAPYISQEMIDAIAMRGFEKGGTQSLTSIAPYVSQEIIDECAKSDFVVKGLRDLTSIASFISQVSVRRLLMSVPRRRLIRTESKH